MDIFVSHAWEDKSFIIELLQLPDFMHVWIDKSEMAAGYELTQTLRETIDDSHVFLLAISQLSISKSWVAQELAWARQVETMRKRRIILPIALDEHLEFDETNRQFESLLNERIYINATDRSLTGKRATVDEINSTLFRWLNDWLEEIEPKGNGNTLFIEKLDSHIKEYQKKLYALKAALHWPLSTLVRDDALAYLDSSRIDYNEFTAEFLRDLSNWEDEVKWRFEKYPYKQYLQLVAFIRDDIYHGAAYALNEIVSAINSYDELQSKGSDVISDVEKSNLAALSALDAAVEQLTTMTADYLSLLKTE